MFVIDQAPMKKMTIADFKEYAFNPLLIVEGASTYDINETEKAKSEISDAVFELDALKEAIIFKREKMKANPSEKKMQLLSELYKETKGILGEIKPQQLESASKILQKRKELVELKVLLKTLKYSMNSEQTVVQVLDTLIDSDEINDWLLLAEILYAHMTYSKYEKTVFVKFSKRLEEKVAGVFQESVNSNNIHLCRACFDILSTVGKEYALIDTFLLIKNLLTTDINIYPPPLSTIDLRLEVVENSTFKDFLKKTVQIIEENHLFIYRVFDLSDEYCEYMFSKIFKTLISMNLSSFLNVSNPGIFLICIQSAFTNLQLFAKAVKTLFPKIDLELNLSEAFVQFIYKAVANETQIFDEVLESFLSGSKTLNNYIINGEKISKTENYVKIYENMLILVDSFLNRCGHLYGEENEDNIMRYYARKLCIIIDKIVSRDKDSLEALNALFRLYWLNVKLLGNKIDYFKTFTLKLEAAIQQEFEATISAAKTFLKSQIANITFSKKDSHLELLSYLRNTHEKTVAMGEKNVKLIFYKVFNTIESQFYAQIQHIDLGKNQLENALKCLDDFSGYFSFNISSSLETRFDHLKLICKIICAEKNKFDEMITKSRSLLTDKELRDIMKCRERKGKSKESSTKSSSVSA